MRGTMIEPCITSGYDVTLMSTFFVYLLYLGICDKDEQWWANLYIITIAESKGLI